MPFNLPKFICDKNTNFINRYFLRFDGNGDLMLVPIGIIASLIIGSGYIGYRIGKREKNKKQLK